MAMQYDPQLFTSEVLPNGITVYTHTHTSPVCYMQLFLPVGYAHTKQGTNIPLGSPHFLEHALYIQNAEHPEPHTFELELALRGCERDAITYPYKTMFSLACPLKELPFATQALMDTVFKPLFTEEPIKNEWGVVKNERERKRRYFPGSSASTEYENTKFLKSKPFSLDQIFGRDSDLESYTPEKLYELHADIAFQAGTKVLAVGNSDFSLLKYLHTLPSTSSISRTLHGKTVLLGMFLWKV
jgi:predicted Zn-dependent peptidase